MITRKGLNSSEGGRVHRASRFARAMTHRQDEDATGLETRGPLAEGARTFRRRQVQ